MKSIVDSQEEKKDKEIESLFENESNEDSDDEEELAVTEFNHEGKKYWFNYKTQDILYYEPPDWSASDPTEIFVDGTGRRYDENPSSNQGGQGGRRYRERNRTPEWQTRSAWHSQSAPSSSSSHHRDHSSSSNRWGTHTYGGSTSSSSGAWRTQTSGPRESSSERPSSSRQWKGRVVFTEKTYP